MIYTFGCSVTKWHWPTWADWLRVYQGSVTNLAYKSYGNENIYWNLLKNLPSFTKDDQIIIMWTQSHRLGIWYDREWIDDQDVMGFFPKSNGKLWFTDNESYRGMYRTHPDYQLSLTHMIVSELQTILNTQLLLDKYNCNYTMLFVHNPYLDCRPVYKPKFEFVWHKKEIITEVEKHFAEEILKLQPIQQLVAQIDWTKFSQQPNPFDVTSYTGMWEYFFNKKEYLIYSHATDPHPVALTHHDFALEKILNRDPRQGKFRDIAIQISEEAMDMPIPDLTTEDYIASAEKALLSEQFKTQLDSLK
jgi:hypothetical protein